MTSMRGHQIKAGQSHPTIVQQPSVGDTLFQGEIFDGGLPRRCNA